MSHDVPIAFKQMILLTLFWRKENGHAYILVVVQSCPTLCHPMGCSMSGFPDLHNLWGWSNSFPLSQWWNLIIWSSVAPFSSWPLSLSMSGSLSVSQLFISGGQIIGDSASASLLPMNIQAWFPLGRTGLISLMSKELSRVFSNTMVQKHQSFGAQLFLWSNSHIHTRLLEKW